MPRDNGRKWRVIISGCIVSCFVYALPLAFGVLFPDLLQAFGASRAETATVQATFQGVACTSGIISGILIKRTSIYHVSVLGSVLMSAGLIASFFAKTIILLDILIGIIAGFGVSMLYVSSNVEVGETFHGHVKDVALSFLSAFIDVGVLSYPYLLQLLVTKYDLHGTLLLLGGVYLNNFAIAILRYYTRTVKSANTDLASDVKDDLATGIKIRQTLYELRTKLLMLFHFRYSILVIASCITVGFQNRFLVVVIDLLSEKGFTKNEAIIFLSVFSISKIFGNFISILFSKVRSVLSTLALPTGCCLLGVLGYLCLYVSNKTSVTFAGMVVAGIGTGGVLSGSIVAIANIVEVDLFSIGLGLHFTLNGLVTLASGPLYGFIRDRTKSYEGVSLVLVAVFGTAGILYTAGDVWHKCRGGKTPHASTFDIGVSSNAGEDLVAKQQLVLT